jgi:hypothetical protein
VRISRIRLSHWFHNRHYDKRDHLARANERSRCLGLTVELLLRDPVSNGVSGRKTNAPRLTLFRSAPNARAPSLHRRYPASSVLWARPTPTQARSQEERLKAATLHQRGSPVLRRSLSPRAVPTTPASHSETGRLHSSEHGSLPQDNGGSALAL